MPFRHKHQNKKTEISYYNNNPKHGYGKLVDKLNKSIYEGEVFQNKKHGHGRLTIQLNDQSMQRYYIGQWKNDRINGYGTLYLNHSAYYEGEFKDNQKSGWGKMFYENGDIYDGEWYNNKRHGIGVLMRANGDRYEGQWFQDNKHGYGQYYFIKQKRVFQGLWSNDICKSSEQIC